eukprot:jgi/Pico_ML_1/55981/g1584.t1
MQQQQASFKWNQNKTHQLHQVCTQVVDFSSFPLDFFEELGLVLFCLFHLVIQLLDLLTQSLFGLLMIPLAVQHGIQGIFEFSI